MALESATYIDGLVQTNPLGTDDVSQGDDHLRLIKTVLKSSFPTVNGALTTPLAALNGVAQMITVGSDGTTLAWTIPSGAVAVTPTDWSVNQVFGAVDADGRYVKRTPSSDTGSYSPVSAGVQKSSGRIWLSYVDDTGATVVALASSTADLPLKANKDGGNALTGTQTISDGGTFKVVSTLDKSSVALGMDGTTAGQAILVVEDAEGNITNVLRLDGTDCQVTAGKNFRVTSPVDGSFCRFTMDGGTGGKADLILCNASGAILNALNLMSDGTAAVSAGTLATTSQLPFVNSDTNLRIQAFTVTSSTGGITTVTFPIAFKAGTVPVVMTNINQELDGNDRYTSLRNASDVPHPITNTSFVVIPVSVGAGASISPYQFVMQVIAVGYI